MRSQDWPSARDYCEAILDPDSLVDRELREGTLECHPGGRPKTFTGTFTTTFHFETASGGVAFRCYVRGYDDLARRYRAIADVLRYARIEGLCKTQYLAEGICVRGAWWPAVKMDWVAGRALNAEVEARLDDPDGMLALAMRFGETVRSLGVLGIAHGDLQPANIIVTDGELRLIDYDAMFLPAIAGLPQTEYGHRNFQHPSGDSRALMGASTGFRRSLFIPRWSRSPRIERYGRVSTTARIFCSARTILRRTGSPNCSAPYSRTTRRVGSPKCCSPPAECPLKTFQRSSMRLRPPLERCPR